MNSCNSYSMILAVYSIGVLAMMSLVNGLFFMKKSIYFPGDIILQKRITLSIKDNLITIMQI